MCFAVIFSVISVACDQSSTDSKASNSIRNVGVLISPGMLLNDATAPFDIYKHIGEERVRVYFVAESMEPVQTRFGAKLWPHFSMANAPKSDVLVVATAKHVDPNHALIPWIRSAAQDALLVSAHGEGVYALGHAGLVDGKQVSVALDNVEEFRQQFLNVSNVLTQQRFVQDGKILTSMGGLASFEAAVHVTESLFGASIADTVATGLVFAAENRHFARFPQESGIVTSTSSVGTGDVKNVAILIMDGLYISEAVAPFQVYQYAGEKMNVYFVGENLEPITGYYGERLAPHYQFADAPQADVLVIPSGLGSMDADLQNQAQMNWIQEQAQGAQWVTSHCWGAFALAQSGLLDGKQATTFPGYFEQLRMMFPAIAEVVETSRVVQSEKVITSNGGLAAFEASVYVIELLYGSDEAKANAAANIFAPENLYHAQHPLVDTFR